MNFSRLFILRPVATALVDGGDSSGGNRRLSPAARLRSAAGRLSDDSSTDVLSWSRPRCHGVFRHSAARAAVRTGSRPEPDDVIEFDGKLHHHPAVLRSTSASMSPNRKCRPPSMPLRIFLPRDLPNPPVYSKINPADAPILTLALTSKTLPLVKSAGSRRHTAGAKDLAIVRRRTGQHQRRTEARRADSGQSDGALAGTG